MLENRKNVRKIIAMVIALIVILGVFINYRKWRTEERKIESIAAEEFGQVKGQLNAEQFGQVKSSTKVASIDLDDGVIIPMYKPQWEKVSSTIDTTNKKIQVVVKGYAYKDQDINSDVTIDYGSDVDSTLSPEDITLFIDGAPVTTTKPKIEVSSATTETNDDTDYEEVTHTITISDFIEGTRTGTAPFKEWSGNIALKIKGRGKESSTYNADVLTDDDGNQNMMESDEGQTEGTWIDITFKDDAVDKNTNGKMFTDFVRPELTYLYSNTVIGNGNKGNTKKVTIVFDVIDKYFKQTSLATDTTASNITVKVEDDEVNSTVNVNKVLRKVQDVNHTVNGVSKKIGERYQLEIIGLDKSDGFTYSGPMTLAFNGNIIEDNSGNKNNATTITVGVDETDGNENETAPEGGVVVDVVSPTWELVGTSLDTGEITIRAKDKYFASTSLQESHLTVYVNGVVSEIIETDLSAPVYKKLDASDNYVTTNNPAEAVAVEYKVTLENLTPDTATYIEFVPKNASDLVLKNGKAKYREEYGGNIELEIAAGVILDDSNNASPVKKFTIGNIDSTKPEIYDIQKTEDAGNDKLTFVFNVTDRNYNPENLIEKSELTLWVDGTQVSNDKITSFTHKEIQHQSIDGVVGKVLGHQYTAVVEGFVETDAQFAASGRKYKDLSGTVQIKIDPEAAEDKNGNPINSDTTTISEFIDYIKPEIQQVTVTNPKNTADKEYTMSFKVLDKYIDTENLVTEEEITVYVDGEPAASISKDIISATPITENCKKTINGVITEGTQTVGHTYTLVLSGFEQSELQGTKNFMEWSGTVKIEIAQNAVNDKDGKTNTAINTLDPTVAKRTVTGEHVDFIKPVVEMVNPTRGTNKETIVFNVIDKYLDTTDLIDKNTELKVYIDDVEVTDLTKELTRVTANDVTANVNGTSRTVSQQYKLELTGFEQASRNANGYKDWSGTVKIEILENAVKDTSNNKLATETAKRTMTGDFVDFIKPDLKYTHQSTDINTGTKKYTMTFDITDKYYSTGELALTDLAIKMQNGQKDASGNLIIYDLNALDTAGTIDLELVATPIYLPVGVKYTNTSGSVVEATASVKPQIGHTYTLTVSNLEKLEIEAGLTTANYSGIVTVAVAADKIKDRGPSGNGTTPNGNLQKTITSGVNIPGGSGTGTVVDVVDPLWTKDSSSATAREHVTEEVEDPNNPGQTIVQRTGETYSTATLTINGTDTYLNTSNTDDSTLTSDEIEIYVNGSKVSITPTIEKIDDLEESRTLNGTTSTVKYGVQYKISFTGFAQDANQVKVRILEDSIKDQTGNGNKETDFIVYNVLRLTNEETNMYYESSVDQPFLGESVETTIYPEGVTSITPIGRGKIVQVIFANSTAGSKVADVQRVWDVSAQGDDSIIAWTSQTTAPYTVYIGSNDEIFANQDSSKLFSYISSGFGKTGVTETIQNIELLNTSSVIKMNSMFRFLGYANQSVTTFDLGDNFDTSNVTDMETMFSYMGNAFLTTFDLGDNFDTSKVSNMYQMFFNLGLYRNNLSKPSFNLQLGGKFDTSEVNNMDGMFALCAMSNIELGNLFDTSNVEKMSSMFEGCYYLSNLDLGNLFDTSSVKFINRMFADCTAMATINFGDKFNTSSVQNMSGMFQNFAANSAMTSLDLGDQFYTTAATNMSNMFNGCGSTAMKIIDLGPAFTKIADTNTDFATNAGKSGECIIYAPESIYKNKTAFKKGTTDTTTTIAYSNGTINPIYRPQWEKVSSSFDNATAPTKLNVNIKGTAAHTESLDSGKVNINYESTVTTNLTKDDIQVYINGQLDGDLNKNGVLDAGETPSITKVLTTLTPNTGLTEATHTLTLSGFEQTARQTGVPFKEWSGNISIRIGGRGEATSTYSANELTDTFGNQSMMQTDETGTWVDVIYKDADSTTNVNTNGTMFIDNIKPEFTYKSTETAIGNGPTGDKKVKVVFDVIDKYFDSANIQKSDITIKMSDYGDEEVKANTSTSISKKTISEDVTDANGVTYKTNGDIYYNGNKIGERYEFVIQGLEQKYDNPYEYKDENGNVIKYSDGFKFSGYMSLAFASNKVQDKSGNKNAATVIAIGLDENDGNPNDEDDVENDGVIVDVVDPVWELVSASVDTGEIVIRAKDKYFKETTLTKNDLTIYANKVVSTEITKNLSNPTYKKLDGVNYVTTENIEEAVAVEYTITLGNITLDNAGYTSFVPTNAATDGLILDADGKAKYRSENGGIIELGINAGVIKDDSGNVNKANRFPIGNMDSTKPEVYDIKKTQDPTNNQITFVFNVTDRNYAPSNLVETDEFTLWVDDVQISNDKIKSFTYKEIKAEIDDTTKVLGHQYTLVVNKIVETDAEYTALTREFRELSGTLEVRIDEEAANDGNLNTLNPETTTLSDFVDYIKPQVTYQYAESTQETAGDIDYSDSGKTFKMVFDITDKYFENSTLTINDLTIKIDGETPNWRAAGGTTGVSKKLESTEIKKTFNKTVNGEVVNAEYVIGKRYTLLLENLEQLEILTGKKYLDYSGVITVDIPVGTLKADGTPDKGIYDTSKNLNNAITITSGIDIKGDVQDATDSSVVVDVVDPLFEKVSTTAYAVGQTATIEFKGTDKYFRESKITQDNIKTYVKVFAHTGTTPGTLVTDITNDVNIVIDSTSDVKATVNNVENTLIGKQYKITITGYAQDVNQIKIQIQPDTMFDTSGNGNKVKEIIAYNTLELTNSETEATSGFLGETSIQRQNIHKVIFVNSKSGKAGATKVWDVSATGDNSILAWYNETSAPYTVYIGSDDEIFANQDSSYLLSYIGYAENSTATTVVESHIDSTIVSDFSLLNTSSVKDMSYMFNNFGHKKMTKLDLGNFDTKNVTNMPYMFNGCGQTAMETLDLGNKFDTTNVTNMSSMFQNCGATALTALDLSATGITFNTINVKDMTNMFSGQTAITTFNLGSNFNTEKVENMSGMFQNFGLSLETLTLGNSFYTSEVTEMSNMFNGCGTTAMKTLNLGPNFDTTKVQNMSGMFQNFAKDSTTMTTLDLGNKFYTTAATNMSNMFNGCGATAMTTLDLGPAFTKIASTNTDFVTGCGTTGAVIKAAESIFKDKNNFRLGTDSTTTVGYTVGTIEATYKPIWTKISSSLQIDETDIAKSTMTVVVNGKVDTDVYGDAIKTITSAVVAGNDANNQITVKVDGENAETIKQTIVVEKATETEVQYKITLSNFVELARQTAKGKNFLEWSGNLALQLVRGSLEDAYGNKNMVEMNGETIQIEDETPLTANVETDKMFADYVKPEFTYEYADTIIGDGPGGDKKVKVVFDVTDKYFKESTLSSQDASLITVKIVEDEVNSTVNVTKTLTLTNIFVMNKQTKEITTKAANYTLTSTEQKVGERYELLVEGLQTEDGKGYSGPMTLAFTAGTITDLSNNLSDPKTITIGIDDPTNPEHPDHDEEVNVDVVNPKWVGPHDVNTIDRTADTVSITILGNDKYYASDVFGTDLEDGTMTAATLNKIKVYVDDTLQTSISKSMVAITDETQLQTLATNAGLTDVKVGYILTLGNFGDEPDDISGKTKIVIDAGTITDESENINTATTIFVGNEDWTETGDNATPPRYPAFRNDIVDFIDPVINYTYSTTEGSENPDVDYEEKQVTVKFSVTDKYLLESKIINADGTLNTDAVRILIHDHETNTMVDRTNKVQTSITADSTDLTDGEVVYTLVVSNIQQTPNNAFDFSGIMQLVFTQGMIDDKSGNINSGKTITLDTEIGPGIVDVVDPIIKYWSSSIDRDNKTVTIRVRAEDKYISSQTILESLDKILVKVVKPNGVTVTDRLITADGEYIDNENSAITKTISSAGTTTTTMTFEITISNFGLDEGVTSIIIPKDVILDTSGNGNIETEILVGNTDDATAFKDSIVDFTKPTWQYVTSIIQRNKDGNGVRNETGTVTIEVKGTDIYFADKYFTDDSLKLNLSNVKVYINEQLNEDVTVNYATNEDGSIKKESISETDANGDIQKGVKYTLELGNFGTNEGKVRIDIPENAIRDTSLNGNILTPIDVGNETWIETDVETDVNNPKYTAFRNDIVDYIKPVIKYKYEEDVNPKLNTDETVDIIFTATDNYFLESDIGLEDMKIYIDNMQVYGSGTKDSIKINAEIIETVATDHNDGLKYTLRLSALEKNGYIEDMNGNGVLDAGEDINGNGELDKMSEVFERHSGIIKIVFAANQVADSSGNKNIETTIIVDNDNGDSQPDGEIVDFVNPNIYYLEQYINWEDRYALITLRVTDRFYDPATDNILEVGDITLYEENAAGQNVNITSQFTANNKMSVAKTKVLKDEYGNVVGYDYTIKLEDFEEEFEMKICIPEGVIKDTSNNYNDAYGLDTNTSIDVVLDNRRPAWKYVSTDTSNFESQGKISFTVDGVDKFLDVDRSNLKVENIKVLKDGVVLLDGRDTEDATKITVNYLGTNTESEADLDKYKKYQIDVTGLTEMGTYSLVFEKETLIDEYNNKSAAKTISFSNSVIASNTGNYVNVTYHLTPDMETVHNSYVHELMSVNTTGTNFENQTYRPSTIGEIFNNGENPLFTEPMYTPRIEGYTVTQDYTPKSFAGWAVADSEGNVVYYTDETCTRVSETATTFTKVYGLYDEIPKTVTNLKAVWQDAKVIFVSNEEGDNANNGRLPSKAVKDLATAYSKLNTSGTAENNIIVIMDAIEYKYADENVPETLTGNATITSIYAGVDYRKDKNAELKVSSNMIVNGDIIFDNIKLYTSDTTVSDGTDYLENGTYKNMLISNYSGDITIGRGVTTPTDKYTFGAIVGGNFGTETSTGNLGTHTIRVEAGKFNNIIAGSTLSSSTTTTKSITHNVVIGNMKDAAVSRNDKLTITGYVAIGENEQKCYPSGATKTSESVDKVYANVTLYSGTIAGSNKFAKATENAAIYLRSINGQTDGLMNFEMFGGVVQANIYGGARVSTSNEDRIFNTMKFYGGNVTGNIFGQGANDVFTGSSELTLQGNFSITGNVFGGSNVTTSSTASVGEGNSTIIINSSSTTVNGKIYGGGMAVADSTGFVTGTTSITLNSGTVSGIYGSGYNCGNTGETNITIENGTVNGNIFGGAYQNQAREVSNITVLGGTVKGNIYGGNENIESQLEGDTYFQKVNITIGDTDATKKPTINGTIFGGGKYDKVDVAKIQLIECANVISVFGGSDVNSMTITAEIYLNGMTVNEIYGGSKSTGTTTATVSVSNIYLQAGTANEVYGGGYESNSTISNITLEGTAKVTTIYGGSNQAGKVTTSNVTLISGTSVTNVFGGGNSAAVGTANVTLNGMTIEENGAIYGGSKDTGVTTTSNVTLTSGTVTEVFGGGLDVGVTTSNVKQEGATVTTIYGGNNSGTGTGGETENSNVEIINATVENVYGGNKEKGTTRYTNIKVHGTSTITGNLFGGGYKSNITGSTTINIAGGTIKGDINGGSEQGVVYGDTNINIGIDAATGLTAGNIDIIGTIYGAGSTLTEGEITVVGNTNILIDNSTTSPIKYLTAEGKEKSIYGSGKGGAIYSNGTDTDKSLIHLKDLGTSTSPYLLKSIENTGDLYIGNSVVELSGALEEAVINTEVGHYYTLNTITNALTIYNNTTLYTQRGFNKVGGFNSYVNQKTTRATVTIADGTSTTNVDNRLYTLEGINLIFAKEEITLDNKASIQQSKWGRVNGIAFFGTYKNTSSGKKYDLDLFRAGTYVEGLYHSENNKEYSENSYTNGFYTTVVDEATGGEISQLIDTVNYTNYTDWIINAPTINYDVDLVASTYGKQSVAELVLDYKYATDYTYAAETVYTLNQVSSNALKPDVQLIDSTELPTISSNANNIFGLTMETTKSGWKQQALTTILSADNGSIEGDSEYVSDASTLPGTIKFKIHNSINITEERDLGNINIVLTGQQPINGSGTEAYTFKVVIAVSMQTILDDLKLQYTPSFTDRVEKELSYTADSRVDLSYILYKNMETTPYASGDYRVISTTEKLPAGTRITVKDYGQGDSVNKVYYYHVTGNETEVDGTRYLYRLSNFIDMGGIDPKYTDSNTYYRSTEKYVFEKYDISIDFINSNINSNKLAQETYLELRGSSGAIKYNNGDTTIKYNLYSGKNALVTETISNEGESYTVVEDLEIPITIAASILEQSGILDTKYHDQIAGIAVQIVGGNERIKSPELQNFKLTNTKTGEEYPAGLNDGVIRMPIIEGLGSMAGDYILSVTQANVPSGLYTVQVRLYTADDGEYYGTEPKVQKTFNITFISGATGQVAVLADYDTRIINKSTGVNLVENLEEGEGAKAVDMTIKVGAPTNETNIRVELYKRNATYTTLTDETTYTGTQYTLVDIKDYLQGTEDWAKPESNGLVTTTGSKEYMVLPKQTYEKVVDVLNVEFEKSLIDGISTGEYKLVFKVYNNNTLIQELRKTFIVTP